MILSGIWAAASPFWRKIGLRYLLAVCICSWAIYVQMEYRLPGSFLFILLPAVGGALTLLYLILLLDLLLVWLPTRDPFRRALGRVEWWANLVVRVFVYFSLLLYTNGKLDQSIKVYHPAEIISITDEMPLGVPLPYTWVTVRDRNDPEKVERVLLKWSERRQLWGAEPVAVDVREGYFGIPWIAGIERDWDYYGREILRLTPSASRAWKKLVYFNITHNRVKEATTAAEEYLRLYPKDYESGLSVASSLLDAGYPEEAVQFADYAVANDPTYNGYQILGVALSYSSNNLRAWEVLEISKPLNPTDWEVYYHLGYVFDELGMYKESLEHFEVARERWGDYPEIQQKIREVTQKLRVKEAKRKSRSVQ